MGREVLGNPSSTPKKFPGNPRVKINPFLLMMREWAIQVFGKWLKIPMVAEEKGEIMGAVHSVGPHQALAISGGCCVSNTRIVVGTWAWAWWWVTDVQKISLGIRTLHPICHDVMTAEGVPLTCTGIAQVKVFTAPDFMKLSVQQFLGKSEASINSTLLHTLEGHFRAILSTLTVEEINGDRIKFAKLVSEVASPDLGRMGIVIP